MPNFRLYPTQQKIIFIMRVLLALFIGILFSGVFTQVDAQKKDVCGFDIRNRIFSKNAEYRNRVNQMESKIQSQVSQIIKQRKMMNNLQISPGGYTIIPVVVHVVQKSGDLLGSATNPNDQTIKDAIADLNAKFAADAGSGNVGYPTPIRFALAKRSPNCVYTNGIVRVNGSTLSGYDQYGVTIDHSSGANADDLKNLSRWPIKQYYNIWVVHHINADIDPNSFITGFADLPINIYDYSYFAFPSDGMVIIGNRMAPGYSTLMHEMGHAFALFHTFQTDDEGSTCAPNTDCSNTGDRVCDTDPVQNLLQVGCPGDNDINPCTSNPYNNAQRNIMGYGDCLDRITLGQSTRMMAALQAARGGLAASEATTDPPPAWSLVKTSTQIPGANTNTDMDLDNGPYNVSIGNLNYTSSGSVYDGNNAYYIDNTCNIGTVISTVNQILEVTTRWTPQTVKVWIDFNNNGTFDGDSERVMNSTATTQDFTHTATIPAFTLSATSTVKNTLLRMRVRADFPGTNINAGNALVSGQTEDFWVKIESGLPVIFGTISASFKNDLLTVKWNTNSETNCDHFVVEGSVDGNNFVPLKEISSKATGGNSSAELQYSISFGAQTAMMISLGIFALLFSVFTFNRRKKWLVAGVVLSIASFIACKKMEMAQTEKAGTLPYIRILQVDKDGGKHYSKVITVTNEQ